MIERGFPDQPNQATQIYPPAPPRVLPAEASVEARSLFEEGSRAESAGALRAAAALYRATVESIVEDQECEGKNLEKKIDALADKGVDPDLIRDLHEARLLGNWSLHEGLIFSPEEVADVAELINDACQTLYVLPATRAALREARARRRAEKQG